MKDPILLWNEVALEANRVSHTNGAGEQTGPTLSSRALAIVHLAMYDAYAGVVNDANDYPRYINTPPTTPLQESDIPDAIAGAAYTTLSALFPSQQAFFDTWLAAEGNVGSNGHIFGVAVGDAILLDRKDDPGAGGNYMPSLDRGKHRVDPDNPTQGFHGPEYGAKSKGFAITDRHEIAEPPFDDAEYRAAVEEVREKGIQPELIGTLRGEVDDARTPEQTLIGVYWAYDGVPNLGTPPRLYNQIIRKVAEKKNNSVGDNARLFAFVNAAMGDAGILAWDQKYIWNFWRPVVGIREHDPSMGPAATDPSNDLTNNSDPFWLPLGAPSSNQPTKKNFTPPFPAYPSGHATFGAAAFHITRLFYATGGRLSKGTLKKDKLFDDLDFVSEELNGVNSDNGGTIRPRHRREFEGGLFDMIIENGVSRVFLGVHWVFDAFAVKGQKREPDLTRKDKGLYVGGVPLGLQIAEDIFDVNKRAPAKSNVAPRDVMPSAPQGAMTILSTYDPASPKQ